MKYIIMADGKGTRWNNYQNTPKHLIEVEGEILIKRTIRQLKEKDKNSIIIITSHDKRYEFDNSTRYEPLNNILEIDRFTQELIEDNICFLYGDTYYTDKDIDNIIRTKTNDILFFGNKKSIVSIKIKDSKIFKQHFERVKQLYLEGKIKECKGWQIYQSFQNLEFDIKQIKDNFVMVEDITIDYNTPEEYENRKIKSRKK